MRRDRAQLRAFGVLISLVVVLCLNGCASSGRASDGWQANRDYGDSGTFPVPREIRNNVEFWRHVYSVWERSQVAIHDNEHLGVVYEVASLPGKTRSGYSRTQREWVRARARHYARRLRDLEDRVRRGQKPAPGDRELLAKLERFGGKGAIYGAADRVRTQRGLRERFRRGVEISGRYDKIFREIMRSHGVPEDLAYLPHVESSFQTNARSSVGAGGVWQFMPATGRLYMRVDSRIDERFDPILAADGAARYLSQAYRRLGSWPLAITSYNHGQGGMAKAKARYGNDIGRIVKQYDGRAFGFASRNFYSEFIAAREVARHADRYFPNGLDYEKPWSHDRLVLPHGMPVEHLARHYGTSTYRLADLNLHWRDSVRRGRRHLPAGSTVWLPAGSTKRVASLPPPVAAPILVARVEPKAKAKRRPQPTIAQAVKTVSRPKSSVKPAARTKKVAAKTRYHVVKPKETLYRVALQNGLSVAELRKLNKMRPGDNHIQPGQRLKVGI